MTSVAAQLVPVSVIGAPPVLLPSVAAPDLVWECVAGLAGVPLPPIWLSPVISCR